jgi:PAS domain-containing protein
MNAAATAEGYLQIAMDAAAAGDGCQAGLDALPVPVYVTDSEGLVTYWNRASVSFAGREPQLGQDRWCVTWRLYTTSGDPLPHDRCPMAEAINKQVAIRGKIAIALRPDGTRVAFRAYPTPLVDESGKLTGAINLLLDVSHEQAHALAEQSARCRRLARATHDRSASAMLEQMACDYATSAAALAGDRQDDVPAGPSILSGGIPTIS